MVNLDRLKGSGLLIDGFGELLAKWYEGESPNGKPFRNHPIFEKLPPEIERFHRLIHLWPQSKIGSKPGDQKVWASPPVPRKFRNPETRGRVTDENQIVLAHGNCWVVWLSLREGLLFTDLKQERDEDLGRGEFSMQVSIDEFLVTLGLFQWIVQGGEQTSEMRDGSTLIFSGRYVRDQVLDFCFRDRPDKKQLRCMKWCLSR